MNHYFKKITYFLAAAAIAFSMSSCEKDNTIMYNNCTMGNIVDGRFVSDQGNIFNTVEQVCTGDLLSMKRAFVICDVLNKTEGGEDNEYDVRLNQIVSVLTKDVVPTANITTEMLTEDPIHVEYAWLAGGYMNMYVMFPIKVGSTTTHLINLVHEGNMTNPETGEDLSGTYRFSLRHNANGDKIDQSQIVDYIMAGGYVSFPINKLIQEKEAIVKIEWTWYKTYGTITSSETELKGIEGTYVKDGFEHPSKDATPKTMAIIE